VVLFHLDRIDLTSYPAPLRRPVSDYFRTNIWVTSSGLFSQRYLRWANEVIGTDRIMCATDYSFPHIEPQGNRRFLEASSLSQQDREKVASGNWERLRTDILR
jgi:predicted TIM-barrel fold metal-dependent hydrolase